MFETVKIELTPAQANTIMQALQNDADNHRTAAVFGDAEWHNRMAALCDSTNLAMHMQTPSEMHPLKF